MKAGVAMFVIGAVLLTFGVFVIFDRGAISRPSFAIGLVLTTVAFLRLGWAGWRGSIAASIVAGLVAVILTWTYYELIRQTPGVPPIGFLDEMTAPVLSAAAGLLVLVVGIIRARGHRGNDAVLGPAAGAIDS